MVYHFDPFTLTIAVFESMVRRTPSVKKKVEGRITGEDENNERAEEDNRRIMIQQRLPTFFPDPFAQPEE